MTPEQAALLRKAGDALRAAELLLGERLFESAVSRAYYAMFYVAEAFLLGEGLAFSKHSAVIGAFGHRFAKKEPSLQVFHQYLIEGQDNRNVADYDIDPSISEPVAAQQVERARGFLGLARKRLAQSTED